MLPTSLLKYSVFSCRKESNMIRLYIGGKKMFKAKDKSEKFLNKLIIILSVFIIVEAIILSIFEISTADGYSMEPTLAPKAVAVGVKVFEDIRRGDIVMADPVNSKTGNKVIKRVVAVEGDRVLIENGNLYINGVRDISSDYYYIEDMDIVVPDNCYFLLGDNRAQSYDSRHYGCVTRKEIVAKYMFEKEMK